MLANDVNTMLASDVPIAIGITSGSAMCCAANSIASVGTTMSPPPIPSKPPVKPAKQPTTKYNAKMVMSLVYPPHIIAIHSTASGAAR